MYMSVKLRPLFSSCIYQGTSLGCIILHVISQKCLEGKINMHKTWPGCMWDVIVTRHHVLGRTR